MDDIMLPTNSQKNPLISLYKYSTENTSKASDRDQSKRELHFFLSSTLDKCGFHISTESVYHIDKETKRNSIFITHANDKCIMQNT